MAGPTLTWWGWLCAVSALNVLAWAASARWQSRRAGTLPPDVRAAIRWQLALSAVYVLGCAYRSVFPVFDIRRLCLVDTWWSSVIVGRSVATVAELCFAAQWALLLRGVSRATGSRLGRAVSRAVLPMIAVAELSSWYAVLTTSNLGHVVEESIWGLCAALLVGSLAIVWRRCRRAVRPVLAAACAIGVGYVAYMAGVDVPMYWARWLADLNEGRPYLGLAQGLADVSGRWVVSHRWADWHTEVVWMSAYFSVAVWLSIGLVHLPALLGAVARQQALPVAPRRPHTTAYPS